MANTMQKYRPAGEVFATEVTEKNLDALADLTGGQVFTGPERLGGQRYLLVETPEGTQRADVGSFVEQRGEGKRATFAVHDAATFQASYTR